MKGVRKKTITLELELELDLTGSLKKSTEKLQSFLDKYESKWESIEIDHERFGGNYKIIGKRKETDLEYNARLEKEKQDSINYKKYKIDIYKKKICELEKEIA